MKGYLRLSLTASDAMIERALPIFAAAQGDRRDARSHRRPAVTPL
jgi:hypothetical protein